VIAAVPTERIVTQPIAPSQRSNSHMARESELDPSTLAMLANRTLRAGVLPENHIRV
jgi:hypothetical protein